MCVKENKVLSIIFVFIATAGLVIYYNFNPLSETFLIKCPFKFITGLECPGCGSQRALHELLHGNFKKAFAYNSLFMIALPYAFLGILFEYFTLKYRYPKTRKILFGRFAIYTIAAVIMLFFIFRNL